MNRDGDAGGGVPPPLMADDRFWLQYATTLITDSQAQMTRQAERLAVAAGWFWSVYLAFIGWLITTGQGMDAVAAGPVVVLLLAYLAATTAQGPVAGSFDPRAPEDIVAAANSAVAGRLWRLRCAHILLGLAAVLIAVVVSSH